MQDILDIFQIGFFNPEGFFTNIFLKAFSLPYESWVLENEVNF